MAKKKTSRKRAPKATAKEPETLRATGNDTILKAIFIVLGIAVVAAAYYVGFLVGSGGAGDVTVRGGNGNLVITEYSDFECPFCQSFYDNAYKQIKAQYGDDVTFEFKQFPLSFHPNAQKAAEASECARDQDMFWEYHDRLFESKQLTLTDLKRHAAELDLDTSEFNNCLDSGEKASVVAQDIQEGQAAGVRGTPSFMINGELVVGAQPFEVFKQKIDAAMSGAPAAPAAPTQPTQPAAPAPTVDPESLLDDDAVKGDPDAPVTIVEFSDYECPFCGRHFQQTYPQIVTNYIDTGKVKLVYRDFPLSFHPQAQKAAEAAECAGEQGKYFEMHDKLFENQQTLSVANYKTWAGELGLSQTAFDECLDSGSMAAEVATDMSAGQAAGVTGTPGFFVNGVKISGAQPYSVFETAIEAALAE